MLSMNTSTSFNLFALNTTIRLHAYGISCSSGADRDSTIQAYSLTVQSDIHFKFSYRNWSAVWCQMCVTFPFSRHPYNQLL